MMKKIYSLFIFLAGSYCSYAQEENGIVDLMIECYEEYFDFNKREEPKPAVRRSCLPEPEDFYAFFNTKFIDFASLREGNVTTFSFSDSLCSPLKRNLIVTSKYGMRDGRKHYGVDFKANVGDTVCSIFCGKVRIAKYDATYGNVVVVRHYNRSETVYAHLDKILVSENQEVIVGEPVGLGGNTGNRSTGPHLHFEIRFKGYPINPVVDNKLLKHISVVFATIL